VSKRQHETHKDSQLREERRHWWRSITRDLVLFTVGLLLLIFEAVVRGGDPRESLLVIYAGMMGLPAILRADELRRSGGKK
jgi:hypothetical protein